MSVARSRICVKSSLCSQSASQLSTTLWVKCCRKSSPWWSPKKYLPPESPLAELPVFLLRVCESLIRGWVGGILEQEDEVLSRQAPGLPAGHHVVVFQEVSLIFFFGSLAPPARSNRHTHYYRHNKMSVVTAILADSWDHHVRTSRATRMTAHQAKVYKMRYEFTRCRRSRSACGRVKCSWEENVDICSLIWVLIGVCSWKWL